MSAIERCLYEMPPHLGTLREHARTELAGYTEIGPCGKHRKADWVEPEGPSNFVAGQLAQLPHCKICREIEQAVEREIAYANKRVEAAEAQGEREVAGMREAAADIRSKQHAINCGLIYGHIGVCTCSAKQDSEAIRSLDSSAAQLGKQRIREEALAPVKQLAEKWLGWAGKPTQEAMGCGNTDDERNEAANDAYRDAANSLLTLIDKPGGR